MTIQFGVTKCVIFVFNKTILLLILYQISSIPLLRVNGFFFERETRGGEAIYFLFLDIIKGGTNIGQRNVEHL